MVTSVQSKLAKGRIAAARPSLLSPILFNGQVHVPVNSASSGTGTGSGPIYIVYGSLGPAHKSVRQAASRSVQPFCTAHACAQHAYTDHATYDMCTKRPRLRTACGQSDPKWAVQVDPTSCSSGLKCTRARL